MAITPDIIAILAPLILLASFALGLIVGESLRRLELIRLRKEIALLRQQIESLRLEKQEIAACHARARIAFRRMAAESDMEIDEARELLIPAKLEKNA